MPNVKYHLKSDTVMVLTPEKEDFEKLKGFLERISHHWLHKPDSDMSPFKLKINEKNLEITLYSDFLFVPKPCKDVRIKYASVEQLLDENNWYLEKEIAEEPIPRKSFFNNLRSYFCLKPRPY